VKRFDVVTIFPEMFDALADHGITRRALDEKAFELQTWDPRDFTTDNYRRVDDRPYGGGPGMVMLPIRCRRAIDAREARQREAGVERRRCADVAAGRAARRGVVQELAASRAWC
jgi:tRNA (guanine37-N1)-methyltransferase